MDAQTYEDTALPYVLMKPEGFEPGAGWPLVILMHGRGASMHDLAGFSSALDGKGYVYAFPNAPYRMNFGPGMSGFSWVAGQQGVEDPPAGAPPVNELLHSFVGQAIAEVGAEPGQVVIGGFSQGGGMTLRYGLLHPETFAGLIVLSGAFRNRDETEAALPAQRDQKIFIAHGTNDQVLPVEQGRDTRDFLVGAGYSPAYYEYEMAHEISHGVVRDLVPWLHQTLPPKT